jgi:ABC-2 type transport system ATP-binding protein
MSLIRCHNLSKHYGSKKALDGINIELNAGAPIALVGPNGAGKTTLFSLLCGYLKPTQGQVLIMGQQPGSPALLNTVSALPQDAALDPNFSIQAQFSLFARLQGFSPKQAREEALRVLALVELVDVAEQKPASLSHGMSKRVAIAQALIGSPKLVLLDEPTAGLDPASAKKVRDLVSKLKADTTFVISSHNLDELEKLCDQVLYLDKGRLGQSLSLQAQGSEEYLTLTMQRCDPQRLLQALEQLGYVVRVERRQDYDFLIQYRADMTSELESDLFKIFREHNWQYKMLLRGRSLEDTLFSTPAA